jgi:hypothetical protein
MSDHSGIVVKVLVDASFYKKCLSAYHDADRKKSTQSSESSREPDLEGSGVIFKVPPELVPETDFLPIPQNKLESSTIVMPAEPPLIVPASASDKPEKLLEKKGGKKTIDQTHTSGFKRPKGAPWYYIGLHDD